MLSGSLEISVVIQALVDGVGCKWLESTDCQTHLTVLRRFIIDGVITLPIALYGFLVFPDIPATTKAFYLSEEVNTSHQDLAVHFCSLLMTLGTQTRIRPARVRSPSLPSSAIFGYGAPHLGQVAMVRLQSSSTSALKLQCIFRPILNLLNRQVRHLRRNGEFWLQ